MTVKLLGEPRYLKQGEEQRLPAEHPLLLLTYLNAHEAWISRQEILNLFYTDEEEGVARNKLRQLLFRAKKQSWFDGLEARAQHLKHSAQTDLKHFREAVEKGSWADAVAAYGGPLLRDTPVTDLPAYEAWLDNERQDVDGSFEEAAFWHAKDLEEREQHNVACRTLTKLLAKDPLNEEAMQAYLRNALHGEPAKGLELYRQFKASLAKDLGMEPLEATVELAKQLEGSADALSAESLQDSSETPLTQTLHNQPSNLTPFVGRELERGYLFGLLERSRIVTLMGLGGIGKTRLALATAAEYAKELEHGGVFVPLASVASEDLVPGAVLGALGLEPNAQQSPSEQVTDYLKDKGLLLVLDNFEHLMATAFVQTLLAAAPDVRMLVTSRERLNLSQEQVFELSGMALPPNLAEGGGLETFDAVKLFLKSARRNDPSFTLEPGNRQAIFDLCRTLQGVPLALELAASWLRLMSVDEILSEAEQSFDLLESDFSDLPARHQSLRAVFESSWRLLSADEQTTLIPLAVFSGGFTLEAAKAVTEASPRVLLKLVNKSLLRREQTGRFVFLEVVRQYARERLEQDADLYTETAKAHADYYRNLSEAAAPKLKGGSEQLEQLNLLEADHANLRRGLEYFLDANDVGSALTFANSLFDYWFIRGHWDEAQRLYERILVLSHDPNLVRQRTRAIVNTGYIATVQGHYQTATDLLEQSVATFREIQDEEGLAYALLCAGLNANYQARYEAAEKLYKESLAIYKSLGDKRGIANVLHELGVVTIRRAEFERAKSYLGEALELRQSLKDDRGASRTLANLGIIARRQGDYETTKALYRQSLDLSRSSNDQLGTANTLISFGVLVKLQGRYAEARAAYTEALGIFRQAGDRFGEAVILENMAALYRLQQQYSTAREYGEACLQSHRERGDSWGIARALTELGFTTDAQSDLKAAVGYFLEAKDIARDLKDRQLLTHGLRGLSVSLSQTSHTALSCICLSFATKLIEALNIVLVPAEQEQTGSVKTRLTNLLGSEKFAQHWTTGQRLTQDELFKRIEKLDLAALPETSVV